MPTTNNKFLVKNGLAVGSSIDVIDSSGEWIGATGTLQGATGPQGASGVSAPIYNGGYIVKTEQLLSTNPQTPQS